MPNRAINTIENSHLAFSQVGFDMIIKDERDLNGEDHIIFYPGEGTNSKNIIYLGNPNPNAYWIGIHNCGTSPSTETISVQAESLVGDNFTADISSAFDYDEALGETRYIEITAGDIIYGKFSSVGIKKTALSIYIDGMRLLRGA